MRDIANMIRSPNFPASLANEPCVCICFEYFFEFMLGEENWQWQEWLLLYQVLLTEMTEHHNNFLLFLEEPDLVLLIHHVKHHGAAKYSTIINLTF